MAAQDAARDTRPVRSILDSDLYKFTMMNAIIESSIADPQVSYRFTNRSAKQMPFTRRAVEQISVAIEALAELSLTTIEKAWLQENCPYLKPRFLDHLEKFRFRPKEQVHVDFVPSGNKSETAEEEIGDLALTIKGRWSEVILYEVPLMSVISEVYFRVVDTKWDMQGQRTLAQSKAKKLVRAGIKYSEFGSRRRRSYESHKYCIEGLLAGEKAVLSSSDAPSNPGKLLGTSNVHFAHLFGLIPIGTMAHEWSMTTAVLEGYDHANLKSLQFWDQVYSPPKYHPKSPADDLTIALTDTFTTKVFFTELCSTPAGKEIARRWRGLRQDSGDSKEFAVRAAEVYRSMGVDPKTKVIIYSDGLNVDRCLELQEHSDAIGIGAGFGVGTFLTNDFVRVQDASDPWNADPDGPVREEEGAKGKSKALNIVIKIHIVDGKEAVKISDDETKATIAPDRVKDFLEQRIQEANVAA